MFREQRYKSKVASEKSLFVYQVRISVQRRSDTSVLWQRTRNYARDAFLDESTHAFELMNYKNVRALVYHLRHRSRTKARRFVVDGARRPALDRVRRAHAYAHDGASLLAPRLARIRPKRNLSARRCRRDARRVRIGSGWAGAGRVCSPNLPNLSGNASRLSRAPPLRCVVVCFSRAYRLLCARASFLSHDAAITDLTYQKSKPVSSPPRNVSGAYSSKSSALSFSIFLSVSLSLALSSAEKNGALTQTRV